MAIKNTSQLLNWCRNELKLTKEQEDNVIEYVGYLETLLKEERKFIDAIHYITENSLRYRGNTTEKGKK